MGIPNWAISGGANFLGNKYRHGEAQVHGSCSQAVAQRRQRKDEWREAVGPTGHWSLRHRTQEADLEGEQAQRLADEHALRVTHHLQVYI